MIDFSVSYVIHLQLEDYTNQGVKQSKLIDFMNRNYGIYAEPAGINHNIKFTTNMSLDDVEIFCRRLESDILFYKKMLSEE